MTFRPTAEQSAIVEAAVTTSNNLLISALAGAAKTSTLVLIANALPSTSPILCLAFNKRIAEEMKERLPSHCSPMTLSSCGYRAWSGALGKRLKLDDRKMHRLFTEFAKRQSAPDAEFLWSAYEDYREAIALAKNHGYLPSGSVRPGAINSLMTDDEFERRLDFELDPLMSECIISTLNESYALARRGEIDFADMIYCPTLTVAASFPFFPTILVDETQDLSELNHAMLIKMARGRSRIIAVGDECQSIYAFRGADENSMSTMQQTFSMHELTLSISFRCPKAVVLEARSRAPHMQYPEWAIEGEVRTLHSWSAESLPASATVICRNNAPLFSLAIRLIRDGRYPELVGNDIMRSLRKTLASFGAPAMSQDALLVAIADWEEKAKKKYKSPARASDTAECLRIFATQGENLGEALAALDALAERTGPIKLMTGHKSKGLEFPHVFILDRHLVRTADSTQEQNLLYVMRTRAQETLTYIRSEDYTTKEPTGEA